MKKIVYIICGLLLLGATSCDLFQSLDVVNENQPSIEDLSTPSELYALVANGYSTWYNGAIAASPTMGFACAELFQTGTASWGSAPMWQWPRENFILFNDEAPDPVIIINFGAWYNWYGGIGSAVKMTRDFNDPTVTVEINNINYAKRVLAHSYIIQGLLYANIATLYDKAYLLTDEMDPLTFDFVANTKSYQEVMSYAIKKFDDAIAIIQADDVDEDPSEIMPGVQFNKETLLQFVNSMAARFLVATPRTPAENAQVNWAKVEQYASKGLTSNLAIEYADGWRGKVMTRDVGSNYHAMMTTWGWQRASNWLLHKMAPDDPASKYPIDYIPGDPTQAFKKWPAITNCPDKRLNMYFKYDSLKNWFGADRAERVGYSTRILCCYRYWRYYDVVENESGSIDHYLKVENDTYWAEALLRQNKDLSKVADLINNSRVGIGGLPAASASDGADKLEEYLFYERYVECDMVWPNLGFFDRRRNKDQMLPGTVLHFPIPAPELNMNGQSVYTFGGMINKGVVGSL